MRHYLAIDCGKDGAFALLDSAGNIADLREMPTNKLGKGREIDIEATKWTLDVMTSTDATVIVENPGGHAPSAAGLRSMTYSFAIIKTLLVVGKIRFHEVAARTWQAQFWTKPKMPKGQKFDTKAAAKSNCQKLWPSNDWNKCHTRKPIREGMADASLIAEFGRLNNL